MPVPSTPSSNQADADINNIVLDLNSHWNLQLPIPDSNWSPSKSCSEPRDQQIHSCIRFLYFKDRSTLNDSIEQFRRHASALKSNWQFKPRAESDLLPIRTRQQSATREQALAVEVAISEKESTELRDCLLAKLKPAYETAKRGQKLNVENATVADEAVRNPGQSQLECYDRLIC